MANKAPPLADIRITYGYDATHVIMQFSEMIQNNRMTEKQTRDMIGKLKDSLGKLTAHKKKKSGPTFQS